MLTSAELKELTRPIEPELERFQRLEVKILGNESPLIYSISKHILNTRGKRLRPTFAFLVARTTGMKAPRLVEAALAVEMIHTATLLHDDVIDESDTRRGKSTVNSQWSNLVSVLMGDYFFAKAFTLLVKTGSLEMLERVSRATERVSVGELRQIEEAHNYDLSEPDYIKIISDKTASLFQASAASAPILSGAPSQMVKRLASFGEYTGCAFQIADDLLDFVGEAKRTGKNVGNDLINGKITLPLIYSLKNARTRTKKSIIKILDNGIEQSGFDTVLDFVQSSGGIAYARTRAQSLADQALDFLRPFANNPHYSSLERLATFSINRDS